MRLYEQAEPEIGLQQPRRVGAKHDELAMGKIDDAHRAVDDRQSQRDEQKDRSDAEARYDLFEQLVHANSPRIQPLARSRAGGRQRSKRQLFSTTPFSVQTCPG